MTIQPTMRSAHPSPQIPSVDEITTELTTRLCGRMAPEEIEHKARLAHEIHHLKRERNACILGHNYMEPALFHTVPDVTGDSLELSRYAARRETDVILFCGVRFMAETAKILNPRARVLLPSLEAGCSLAGAITAADVRSLKQRFPGAPIVTYVNTYADVKAESDICCTSGNVARIVRSLDAEVILLLPDEYLARNVAWETGREIVIVSADTLSAEEDPIDDRQGKPTIVGWSGRCEVHEKFTPGDVADVRRRYPDTAVLAHPECSPDVVAAADFSGSTSAMIDYVRSTSARQFLLLTECAMGENVAAAYPKKEILRLCSVRCPHMKQITLEQTLDALRFDRYVIDVPPDISTGARAALERMLTIA